MLALEGSVVETNGQAVDIWASGTLVYTCVLLVVTLKLCLESRLDVFKTGVDVAQALDLDFPLFLYSMSCTVVTMDACVFTCESWSEKSWN